MRRRPGRAARELTPARRRYSEWRLWRSLDSSDGDRFGRERLRRLGLRGGEVAQAFDYAGNYAEGEINFGVGGSVAEAEAQAGVGVVVGQADGGEHVRWLDRAGGAGGACGTGDALEVEADLQGLAYRVCKCEIAGVGNAAAVVTVDEALRDRFEKGLLETVSQRADFFEVEADMMGGQFGGLAKADDAGDVFGAGTAIAFVMAAVKNGSDRHAGAQVQSADALGPVKFVSGDGKQIDAEAVDIDGEFAGGLHGVGVEEDSGGARDLADFFDGLNGAELVVGMHDGDERGIVAHGAANIFGIDEAIVADSDVGDFAGLVEVARL